MLAPPGSDAVLACLPHWSSGIAFGDFTERTVEQHYKTDFPTGHGGVPLRLAPSGTIQAPDTLAY